MSLCDLCDNFFEKERVSLLNNKQHHKIVNLQICHIKRVCEKKVMEGKYKTVGRKYLR